MTRRPDPTDEFGGPTREERAADLAMAEVPTLTDLVVGELKAQGWRVKRDRQGRKGWDLGSGWPDLFAVRGGDHLFIELKREDKDLEPKQAEWAFDLRRANLNHVVWRPSDWRTGKIAARLA